MKSLHTLVACARGIRARCSPASEPRIWPTRNLYKLTHALARECVFNRPELRESGETRRGRVSWRRANIGSFWSGWLVALGSVPRRRESRGGAAPSALAANVISPQFAPPACAAHFWRAK
ncbi:Hypothetical predicted protein, partial [Olea europaea subsp. europaea]